MTTHIRKRVKRAIAADRAAKLSRRMWRDGEPFGGVQARVLAMQSCVSVDDAQRIIDYVGEESALRVVNLSLTNGRDPVNIARDMAELAERGACGVRDVCCLLQRFGGERSLREQVAQAFRDASKGRT